MIRFDVLIEDKSGKHIAVFEGVPAQTRSEAVNKVKQMLTFTAERIKTESE